ncbi:extracellular solute-binding protein [Moritella yayanosii]|uniref:Putative oligopeptide transporter subunit periplasmic-binding component of ABC superfamily transporter yejA n=1 Tax=Moritella yayanosii TaxID=69539 RepID=A0A330LU17_9GAMM|nr:extracellular solute-binding protein [Moritella yayanosii]SQD80360.1 putative oligopeptide transporter subunit; periplasmic-binding component of ABC superfamily transporter yejA [Moritella yayanosii]
MNKLLRTALLSLSSLLFTLPVLATSNVSEPLRHAIAMHGEPAYGNSFTHFDYVNLNAPRTGSLRRSAMGSFDNFNAYIVKGVTADGTGYLFDTLMQQSGDEAFTLYSLVAEFIEVPDDRSWVRFHLNPNARFSDGSELTASDVEFTFNVLIEKGVPQLRAQYKEVTRVEVESKSVIKFSFKDNKNKELALILAQLPVFSEKDWQGKDFAKANLNIPLGSGPYTIKSFDAGRSIDYQRNDDYWAKDLPVNRGRYNFKHIIFDYYKDGSIAFEAFKAGDVDFRSENISKQWATGYQGKNFMSGKIIKEEIQHQNPQGMQAFWFNLRRDKFKDPNVRKALGLMFDFEWTNKTLFYGAYKRSDSFFSNSELAATGIPKGDELALLAPFKAQLPPELFTQVYTLDKTKGDGRVRKQQRQAIKLFKQAGWTLKSGKMLDANGKQFSVEFLAYSPSFERVIQPFRKNLQRIGIASEIRIVDVSQYVNRLNNFDFDIYTLTQAQSLSPGNEQLSMWGSEFANIPGTLNRIGLQDPVVDALVAKVINATDRDSLITATKALDRVLLWKNLVIPQWHISSYRVAYWQQIQRPEKLPKYGLAIDSWWHQDTTSNTGN